MPLTNKPLLVSLVVAQLVENLPAMRETWVRSLGREDPPEKAKATHSRILAWRMPRTVWSMGLQRAGHDWATSLHFTSLFGKVVIPVPSDTSSTQMTLRWIFPNTLKHCLYWDNVKLRGPPAGYDFESRACDLKPARVLWLPDSLKTLSLPSFSLWLRVFSVRRRQFRTELPPCAYQKRKLRYRTCVKNDLWLIPSGFFFSSLSGAPVL